MQISLVGAGYWGSKLQKELETIPNVDGVEIIDIKNGRLFFIIIICVVSVR